MRQIPRKQDRNPHRVSDVSRSRVEREQRRAAPEEGRVSAETELTRQNVYRERQLLRRIRQLIRVGRRPSQNDIEVNLVPGLLECRNEV